MRVGSLNFLIYARCFLMRAAAAAVFVAVYLEAARARPFQLFLPLNTEAIISAALAAFTCERMPKKKNIPMAPIYVINFRARSSLSSRSRATVCARTIFFERQEHRYGDIL